MEPTTATPLCVDLDGTLVHGDLFLENILRSVRNKPWSILMFPVWWLRGKQILKSRYADLGPTRVLPPLNQPLAEYLRTEREKGRRVLLVTAAHEKTLGPVHEAFPFDETLSSTDSVNLKGPMKAMALEEKFGKNGFDYAGDSTADEPVWDIARKVILVSGSQVKLKRWRAKYDVSHEFPPPSSASWRDWLRGIRIHQWAKNLLMALPFLAGHHFHEPSQIIALAWAFLAMSICASGTYLWNDLLDLDFDRSHPTKRNRIAAAAKASPPTVALVSTVLVAVGLAAAFWLKPSFGLLVAGYIIATLSYSLRVKKIPIADIFFLTFLYLSRIIAGLLVSSAIISFWLFAFTFLLFLSLGAAKRFVELRKRAPSGEEVIAGRGYAAEDRELISELGLASGVASAVVLGLYSNSEQIVALYRAPHWLWGLCVIALFWITRVWFLTRRGLMHDDPVVFALKDKTTWLLLLLGAACFILARPIPGV